MEGEWMWREDRVAELLAIEDAEVLFVSGCSSNQGQFYSQLDAIVLLSAPAEVIVDRLARRTTNSFGKRPEELARVLSDIEAIEPMLRRGATLEIDATRPLEEVVGTLLELARSMESGTGNKGRDEA
jgi:hypothetical protein